VKIGSHVSNKGKEMLLGSIGEALSYDANCLMIYMGAPQNSYRKNLEDLRIPEFTEQLKANNISSEDVIIHAPYIINTAQKDPQKRQFAIDFLSEEINRVAAIGAKYIVLHPGALLGMEVEQGLKQIADNLKVVLENTKDTDVVIALETMAGKGTEAGHRFEHLKTIMDHIDSERIKVCFDTCHTFDSGYDLVNNYEEVMEEFDHIIGLDNIKVIHVNDSKNTLGSSKDRHENIGFGNLGFDTILRIVKDERFKEIAKILETPYVTNDEGKKVYPPYKFEIKMLKEGKFNANLIEDIRNYYQK